jgi:PAS domain S-box-containing protein
MLEFLKKLLRGRSAETPTGEASLRAELAGQERAEAGLRHSQEHFGELVSGVRDYAVFLLDPQGHVVTWNAGAERIKGYAAEEIVGQHFSRFYPQEAVERGWPAEELRRAAAEGRFEDEGWRVRKDGTRFWANVVITALRGDSGEVRGFLKITRDLTERKQAEEALRQSEERFRLMVEGVQDYAIFLLDPHGRVASWNAGAERIKGYRAEEIIGQHFSRFYPQEAIDRGWPAHELRVARQVGRFEDEGWRVRKDGSQFWANVVITALYDGAGNFRGFSKVTRDLTERKRAEENARRLVEETTARRVAEEGARLIREQRERLRVTLASIGDAVLSTDADGRITYLNPVAERLVGWTAEEAAGRPLSDVFRVVNEQTRQPVENPLVRALTERVVVGLANQTVLIARDGSERPIDDSAAPIRDAGGRVVGGVLVFRDISDRRRAEQQRNARLAVTHALSEAATVEDGAGGVLRAVCENLGWDVGLFWAVKEQAETLACRQSWHRPGVPVEEFERASRGRTFAKGEGLPGRVWATGKPAWVLDIAHDTNFPRLAPAVSHGLHSAFACPVIVGEQTLGVIEFFTRRIREPDAGLLEMMNTVAGQVGQFLERRRAEEALREADRRKDEFLATLAHELRNPLAPMRNALQVIQMAGNDAAAVGQAREMMERQMRHLVRLVDDLLDLSRVTRGKLELRKQRVDLAAVVRTAVETSRPLIEAAGHHLTITLPPQPVFLDGDPVRLAQVFSNLLNNAAKYTERGGHIWLTAGRQGGDAVVSVRDSGLGIPREMLGKVFELFTQVDRTLEKAQGGLGIGLTLVRRLAEMHGGSVEAKSEGYGHGSEFTVRLPAMLTAPAPDEGAGEEITPPSRRRILVVDDNRDSAISLGMVLQLMGNEVRTAHDGLEAVRAAEVFRPDVLLLDIGLPKLNGYEAARRIRGQPWGGGIVLIAVTGWGQEEDRRRSKEAGFNYHLVKPLEPAALEQLLAGLQATTA